MSFGGIQPSALAQIMGSPDPASAAGGIAKSGAAGDADKSGAAGFGDQLMNAVADLDKTQQAADTAARDVAAGRTDDLAGSLLKIEEAEISLQLATTIRNKAVEAYQEIMRMQI